MFFKLIRQFIFICKMFYIVTSEYCLYLFFKDFPIFIDRLADKLSAINILYVKVFQAIALNNSLIDDSINNKLLLYTDNAPWTADDILYKELILLAREENLTTEENFFVPINSGMISLVFKYTQKETNKDVIVKMKRQGIDEKLEAAIENLEACLYLLSFIPIINKYQITNVVLKNIDMIISQTNFDEEVKNMVKMKENCKNLKYVKIPTVYPDVTKRNPSFILMDYIDGLKITQIKKEDYEGFAKVVMKYGFVTSIVHGFTHGDLHGGNILFIKDDHDEKYPHKIGVLDFGIVYNIDATYKTLLFEVFTEMFTVPVEETAEKLLCSGIIEPMDILKNLPCDKYNDILEFTTDIVRETITGSKKANQIQIYKLLSKLKEYLSNNEIADLGIRPSDNFVKSQLVLAMAHGVTLTLCEDDFITVADTVINELFHTNIIM